jgi:hypothetical protein
MIGYIRNNVKEQANWHIWFAWYPVIVGETPDGDSISAFFEKVLRCRTFVCTKNEGGYWITKYKILSDV